MPSLLKKILKGLLIVALLPLLLFSLLLLILTDILEYLFGIESSYYEGGRYDNS